MSISEAILAELAHEAVATRKMLEVVPDGKLDWQPHDKSWNLGKLASHIAENPGWGAHMNTDELDLASDSDAFKPFEATSSAELVERFDADLASYKEAFSGRDDGYMMEPWTMRNGETVFFTMPRAAALRTWTINHMVHHRGQLSVYLRLLDVALPEVYGPTADSPKG